MNWYRFNRELSTYINRKKLKYNLNYLRKWYENHMIQVRIVKIWQLGDRPGRLNRPLRIDQASSVELA
jgi:hypothetical protein